MKYFYIGKKEAQKGLSLVYAFSNKKVENYKQVYGENCIEFVGDRLPHYITIDGDIAREATTIELYERGIYELADGEFLKDGRIYNIYQFPIPEGIVLPYFNKDTLEWEDVATLEDKINFYKSNCENIAMRLLVLDRAGINKNSEYYELVKKLETFKQKYKEYEHELATKMNDEVNE